LHSLGSWIKTAIIPVRGRHFPAS